jgi:hypothetical protein
MYRVVSVGGRPQLVDKIPQQVDLFEGTMYQVVSVGGRPHLVRNPFSLDNESDPQFVHERLRYVTRLRDRAWRQIRNLISRWEVPPARGPQEELRQELRVLQRWEQAMSLEASRIKKFYRAELRQGRLQ